MVKRLVVVSNFMPTGAFIYSITHVWRPKTAAENAAKEPRKLKKVINLGSDQDLSWGEFVVTSER